VPLALRGLGSGTVLAFARALGEFGATMMVFGWQPGQQTLPIAIYAGYEQRNFSTATAAAMVMSAVSLAMVMLYNRSVVGTQIGARH